MAPKAFFFVNKNAKSQSLSRPEIEEAADVNRYIQEQVKSIRKKRTTPSPDSLGLTLSSSTLLIAKSAPTGRPRVFHHASDGLQHEKRLVLLDRTKTWPEDHITDANVLPIPNVQPSRNGHHHKGSVRSALPSRFNHWKNINASPGRGKGARVQGKSKVASYAEDDAFETLTLQYSICGKNECIDPFGCTSVPITNVVHDLLMYFKSLWYPRTLIRSNNLGLKSSGEHILQECIFDDLQSACILAAMASRLEFFHGYTIKGGSEQYIQRAVRKIRQKLSENSTVEGKHIYAIMKLYVAEAYRSNLESALIHLDGARALQSRLNSWKELDPIYVPTLCACGEAVFLPMLWRRPATFSSFAEPGPAIECFPEELTKVYILGDSEDKTAQALFAYLSPQPSNRHEIHDMLQIIADMTEYASVRRAMLLRES